AWSAHPQATVSIAITAGLREGKLVQFLEENAHQTGHQVASFRTIDDSRLLCRLDQCSVESDEQVFGPVPRSPTAEAKLAQRLTLAERRRTISGSGLERGS